jgi:hypothetical protein
MEVALARSGQQLAKCISHHQRFDFGMENGIEHRRAGFHSVFGRSRSGKCKGPTKVPGVI